MVRHSMLRCKKWCTIDQYRTALAACRTEPLSRFVKGFDNLAARLLIDTLQEKEGGAPGSWIR